MRSGAKGFTGKQVHIEPKRGLGPRLPSLHRNPNDLFLGKEQILTRNIFLKFEIARLNNS